MPSYKLRFRQVHLDFHTSPHIEGIGEQFDRKQWQDALRAGHVDSITCFSKCHHGWSYHPTKVGKMHPHLKFDLLRAQMDASKEIGVNVPIYISAGVDNVMGEEHPEWREIGINGAFQGWAGPINQAGFMKMCFNTPYLDYLCDQIHEAVKMFPEANGVFLDIIFQGECCCRWCLEYMRNHGLDPDRSEDRRKCAEVALERYYRESTAACRCENPDMPVFHNSGHVARGKSGLLKYFSHLELESLPTGGWGYDHFPLSAKYVSNFDLDYLGMTGRFHTMWGEFGGYKHPNALRYECAQMLANGAKCSVGDQLHPNGAMDPDTYAIIGAAYREVEAKEPWCDDVRPVADIAVLSSEAETGDGGPDTGAGRALFEGHFLFTVIDRLTDFTRFRMLILPDVITVDEELRGKLEEYLAAGGRLLLTGKSGLKPDGTGFALDVGGDYEGESPYQPDYVEMGPLAPEFVSSPVVMYLRSQQVRPTSGEVLARVRRPYFNRTWKHFCSHQHAPAADYTDYAAALRRESVLYLAHPVFSIYTAQGAVAYSHYIRNAVRLLLGDEQTLTTNLPSTARVTLMRQDKENRSVLHLLYASITARGSDMKLSPEGYVRDAYRVEVIEDLPALRNVEVTIRLPNPVRRVTLEPQGREITFNCSDGVVSFGVDEFTCHQMVVLHDA